VNFPAGDLSVDGDSQFVDNGDGRLRSVIKRYLYGTGDTLAYTRRYGRWLPTTIAALSPDSAHYAYAEITQNSPRRSRIHVVDVSTAVDRLVRDQVVSDQGFYVVINYQAEGVYLADIGPSGEGQVGLWLLDPRSGAIRAVAPPNQPSTSRGGFSLIGAGAAWYTDLAPGDQPPHQGIDPVDRLVRYDLKRLFGEPWFRKPGLELEAIGLDGQSNPVVTTSSMKPDASASTSEQLWLVTSPGRASELYSGPGSESADFIQFGAPLADDHGLWFGTNKGIYLYTPGGKFLKVSSAAGEVAGRCS
jgi:hypothetical protein